MAPESTPEAKSISSGVSYIPFGIPGLDGQVRGIPTGSTVLLAGASDADGDAFTYTSLATLMLAKHRPEMVPNGIARRSEAIPDSVTYRTMRVGSVGGALDTERQTVFESLIGPTGFRAKATKKIGPSNW